MYRTLRIDDNVVESSEDFANEIESLKTGQCVLVYFGDYYLALFSRGLSVLSVAPYADGEVFVHMVETVDDPALIQSPGFFEAYRDRYFEAQKDYALGYTKEIEVRVDDELLAYGKEAASHGNPPFSIDDLRDMARLLKKNSWKREKR